MKRIIYICILVITITMSLSFTSHAYTEEEKAQAKAWLSAHGYSPDMSGASQAYQDYLDGKFDEELGVDVNGDGIPATTEAPGTSSSQSATTQGEDEENSTEENTEEDIEQDNSTDGGNKAVATGGTNRDRVDEVSESADISPNGEWATSDDEGVGDKTEEKDSTEAGDNSELKEDNSGENTFYQSDKKDEYQEAIMVVVLAMVLMILAGLWLK